MSLDKTLDAGRDVAYLQIAAPSQLGRDIGRNIQ
jgi:hypothetical protein